MRWGWAALGAALLAAPLVIRDPFYDRMLALVLLWAILGSAWNIVGGYAGQVSFGHAIFFGAGAYMSVLVYARWHAAPLAGIPLGVAVSLGIASLIGTPTFRLRGHYFSMATIAVAELTRILVSNWKFLGAAVGLSGPATARSMWDLTYRSSVPYYYIFLGVLAAIVCVTARMEQSRMGFYLRAIRSGERAARSLGVPVRRYKLYAFLLSATFTSLAGSLYAAMVGFIDPDSGLGILISIQMVLTAALGGTGTLLGPLLGAAILIPLQVTSNSVFGGGGTGLTYILYGGIIILLSRFEPGGLLEMWTRYQARRPRRSEVSHAA